MPELCDMRRFLNTDPASLKVHSGRPGVAGTTMCGIRVCDDPKYMLLAVGQDCPSDYQETTLCGSCFRDEDAKRQEQCSE